LHAIAKSFVICWRIRRNLETLGKAEASLHTALREVAVLTAVLGGDGAA
jgi:hypothetical protein